MRKYQHRWEGIAPLKRNLYTWLCMYLDKCKLNGIRFRQYGGLGLEQFGMDDPNRLRYSLKRPQLISLGAAWSNYTILFRALLPVNNPLLHPLLRIQKKVMVIPWGIPALLWKRQPLD